METDAVAAADRVTVRPPGSSASARVREAAIWLGVDAEILLAGGASSGALADAILRRRQDSRDDDETIVLQTAALTAAEARIRVLWDEARTDPLTGVANRRALAELINVEALRSGQGPRLVGLVVLDVDGLKAVNDLHGHQAGDLALQAVAAALLTASGGHRLAGRVGGDEFCLVLPDADEAECAGIARGLVATLARTPVAETPLSGISVSVGWASGPAAAAGELYAAADARLYAARTRRPRRDRDRRAPTT